MSNTQLQDSQRVSIISEALPYIRRFTGKTFVIKYGGASMVQENLKQKVIEDIALLSYVGVLPLVVHGGGPAINEMLQKLSIPKKFVDGLRVTCEQSIEVVEMVLCGKVQKEIVSLLNRAGSNAIGLSGKDANLMKARKLVSAAEDFGFTGVVDTVSSQVLNNLIENNYLPVISSIAPDEDGTTFNINADAVASKVAESIKAEKLIFLTDTPGILEKKNDPSSLIRRINSKEAKSLIEKGVIQGGMIPKVESALEALKAGASSVHILDGTVEHVLLLETFTEDGVGTMITL
ncbi:MAG TPA: acetylglutamate kinase [Vampirovibrionales bacterium]